jgi:hypothetical protein
MRTGNDELHLDSEFNRNCHGQSLIPLINLTLGDEVIGCELGVDEASSSTSWLRNCPNIKKLYLIDSYKPTVDILTLNDDEIAKVRDENDYTSPKIITYNEREIAYKKIRAHYNIDHWSNHPEKVAWIEEDSETAAGMIEDNSLDFIFLDSHYSYEQLAKEIRLYYPKVRKGGLVVCHDWWAEQTQKAVLEFIREESISQPKSYWDNCCAWYK